MVLERGRIKIPQDFFNRTAKKEYVFWARALLREFLQNSVDAGSTQIRFNLNPDKLSLIVKDNGCGMTRDVMLNKLLALGGTDKLEGSVGGFGKAKEILFFAWKRYLIKTNDLLVFGKGPEYALETVDTHTDGTTCIIEFYTKQEYDSVYASAMEYLPRNEIDADIYFDNVKVNYAWGNKTLLKKFDWADIYTCRCSGVDVSIRVKGMETYKHCMFSALRKRVIVELSGKSFEVLTANRDGLNYKYYNELQSFLEELSLNPISAISSMEDDVQELIAGRHALLIPKSLLSLWEMDSDSVMDKSLECHELFGAQDKINKSEFKLELDYDFIIQRAPNYDVKKIAQFMNDPVSLSLAKLWTHMIFEIIVANKIPVGIIKIGFIFSETAKGLLTGSDKCPIVMMNPLNKDVLESQDVEVLVAVLEDIAYHELAHITYKRHDERFIICSEDYRTIHRVWKKDLVPIKGGKNESYV